jgi:hypothetical protein
MESEGHQRLGAASILHWYDATECDALGAEHRNVEI